MPLTSLCVYSGSSWGARPAYSEAARGLGLALASRRIRLIYGAGSVGLMNEVAESALAAGGEVWGVIPKSLTGKNIQHTGLTRTFVTRSMHERKKKMFNLADAFIALPGGLGTLDEMFEVLTWAQLNFHAKPCGFLNVERYFDPLLAFLDHAVAERFINTDHRSMIMTASDPATLLARFESYRPPSLEKWLRGLAPPAFPGAPSPDITLFPK
ncbi:MAG: TIGR00730 family Rossman fold protein [Kiritimatiellia bacterium]